MKNEFSMRFQEKYAGKFVAMKGDKVLANAATFGGVVKKLEKKRIKMEVVEFMHIPKHVLAIY